jgi:hypothetical protein
MRFKILFFFIVLISFSQKSYSQNKKILTDEEQVTQEFKESKFIQIDSIDLPPELKKIEDEIKQNLVDVVIHSRSHTPIFSQKREDGYNESYKKFHGLKTEIYPLTDSPEFYSLKLFYYNWTTNKFDKKLVRRISKYNILNEVRFALYELLLGKDFVKEHKDEIEKQNFDRIQDVRSAVNLQRKNDKKEKLKKKNIEEKKTEEEEEVKKKKKLLREEKEKLIKFQPVLNSENTKIQETENTPELNLNTNEVDDSNDNLKLSKSEELKKSKEIRKSKKNEKPSTANNSETPFTDGPLVKPEALSSIEQAIPTKSTFYLSGTYFDEYSEANGLVFTKTNLRNLGFGARYIIEELTDKPRVLRLAMRVGIPVLKQNYKFPVYRAIESEIGRAKIFNDFQVFAGLDYSPSYFVNLPGFGERLQVFANDFLWIKLGGGYKRLIKDKEFVFRGSYLKSLAMSSNQIQTFSANRFSLTVFCQLTSKHGMEIGYQQSSIDGEIKVLSRGWLLSYVFKLEN